MATEADLLDTTIILLRLPGDYDGPLPGPPGSLTWIGGKFRRRVVRRNGWIEAWATKAEWREVLFCWEAIRRSVKDG